MGDPGARIRLVARAGADPEAERDRADVRDVLGDDALAGRQRREVVRLHRPILVAPCVLLFRLVVAAGQAAYTFRGGIAAHHRSAANSAAEARARAGSGRAGAAVGRKRRRGDAAARLPGVDRLHAASTNPTVVALRARRARLRRREERPDQGLRQPRRHDADRRSPTCARNVHNFWDRGLLGLALDPNFPADPVRLRPLHVRRGDRRHRAALGHGRASPPTPARRRRAPTADGCVVSGPPLAAAGGRQRR